jgi:cytochrome c1
MQWVARGVSCPGLLCLALLCTAACTEAAEPVWIVPGGDARRAPALMRAFGCAACHSIPGIPNADGNVGPPLSGFGRRTYIAGMLSNTPQNLIRWLRNPQGVVPGNAMPNMGVTDAQARDLAAYLYTIR